LRLLSCIILGSLVACTENQPQVDVNVQFTNHILETERLDCRSLTALSLREVSGSIEAKYRCITTDGSRIVWISRANDGFIQANIETESNFDPRGGILISTEAKMSMCWYVPATFERKFEIRELVERVARKLELAQAYEVSDSSASYATNHGELSGAMVQYFEAKGLPGAVIIYTSDKGSRMPQIEAALSIALHESGLSTERCESNGVQFAHRGHSE